MSATASSCTRSAASHRPMHSSCTRDDALALLRCSRSLETSSPSSDVLTAAVDMRRTRSDSLRSPSVRSSFVSSSAATSERATEWRGLRSVLSLAEVVSPP